MNRYAVQYAIVRFQPHLQTGEFANVGIVVAAPELNYFDYRVETRPTPRLTSFFGSLDKKLIGRALQDCSVELERVRALVTDDDAIGSNLAEKPESRVTHLFAALTKDREGMIRYSDIRYALDANPGGLLQRLFSDYVSQSLVAS